MAVTVRSQDPVADNMLLYQRSVGGWPKQIDAVKVDYNKKLSDAEIAVVKSGFNGKDATIDNNATTKEIRHLVEAYKKTKNKNYLDAAEKGIRFLLKMQHDNGGFPQYYPDVSLYRSQVTFNDNAMINAMNVLWDVIYRTNDMDVVDTSLIEPSKTAVAKGIDCILKTQIIINGVVTAWCTQYDKATLEPAKARAFELPCIASAESVGIVEFLMKIEKPGMQIRNAITSAVKWMERSKINGFIYKDIKDPSQPKGIDRVLVPDTAGVVWARFYDIETNRPFFSGRDGIKKWSVAEIEWERRTGYGWYGTWPKKLLEKEYPAWLKKNSEKATGKKNDDGKIIVDINGKGDFTSIQAALNTLADRSQKPRKIFIRNGIYKEKIFITKQNVVLDGEDRDKTIITWDIARDEWRCDHRDDWGVATFNLAANDITLRNLTIANDYGFNNKEPRTIDCASDTATHKKVITMNGHQMALRTRDNSTTRLKAINCRFRAWAGDTVSPWNLTDGMFYFKDCLMEGGVDFYCPRGWSYAENCSFYANTGPASIWHDGSGNADFKTVLKNCTFNGFDGFYLGRYHKDAQFYLIDCRFSKNMADKDIYLVPTTNVLAWGRRVYYFNCHREGGDYAWHQDNLATAMGSPKAESINAEWVFKTWNPAGTL
jgi:pectinesterase